MEAIQLQLNDGNSMPMVAFGCGTAMNKKENLDQIERSRVETIKTALRLGYRHLDTAHMYQTELDVGAAIRESGIAREEIYVTTKYSPKYGQDLHDAIDSSLAKLQLDYVDSFLLHSPYWTESESDLKAVWKIMESIKASGKARSIGVSNYTVAHLQATLASATVPPSINQIEHHPYMQNEDLLKFSREHGIATSAYGVLAPLTRNHAGPLDEKLQEMGKKYGVSPGTICLKWCLESDIVAVTTSWKEQRLAEYLKLQDFHLTEEEMATISEDGRKAVLGKEIMPRVLAYYQKLKEAGK